MSINFNTKKKREEEQKKQAQRSNTSSTAQTVPTQRRGVSGSQLKSEEQARYEYQQLRGISPSPYQQTTYTPQTSAFARDYEAASSRGIIERSLEDQILNKGREVLSEDGGLVKTSKEAQKESEDRDSLVNALLSLDQRSKETSLGMSPLVVPQKEAVEQEDPTLKAWGTYQWNTALASLGNSIAGASDAPRIASNRLVDDLDRLTPEELENAEWQKSLGVQQMQEKADERSAIAQELVDSGAVRGAGKFVADAMSSAVAQLPQMILGAVGGEVASLGYMGLSVYGSSYDEGLKMGLNEQESSTRALLLAATEIATEKMWNVSKILPGKGALDDMVEKRILYTVTNPAKQYLLQQVFGGLTEGFEEAISSVVGNVVDAAFLDQYAGMSGGEITQSMIADLLTDAAMGFASAVILSGATGQYTKGAFNRYRSDIVNEFNNMDDVERAKAIEYAAEVNGITTEEAEQRISDMLQQMASYDRAVTRMDAQIAQTNTDAVQIITENQQEQMTKNAEEVVAQQKADAIAQTIDAQMEAGNELLKQTVMPTENVAQQTAPMAQEAATMSQEDTDRISPVVENVRQNGGHQIVQTESGTYHVLNIKGEARTLHEYNGTYTESQKHMLRLADALGVKVTIVDGNGFNGFHVGETGEIFISSNVQNGTSRILAHELTHHLRQTKAYAALQRFVLGQVKNYYNTTSATERAMQQTAKELDAPRQANEYKAKWDYDYLLGWAMEDAGIDTSKYSGTSNEDIYNALDKADKSVVDEEIVAKFCEDNLNTDEVVAAIVKENRSLAEKIRDWARNLLAKVTRKDVRNLPAIKDLAELEQRFARALNEKLNTAEQTGNGIRRSINPRFKTDYDEWSSKSSDPRKRDHNGYFLLGSVSDALQSVGIDPKKIRFNKNKIIDILTNPEHHIGDAEIRQLPQMLESPILVMQSKTQVNRVVVTGELVSSENGLPVIAAIELKPTGEVSNFVVVASAYERGIQSLIDTSDILYIEADKKRTNNWLRQRRLQLPELVTQYGSIGRVTYYDPKVNMSDEDSALAVALRKAGLVDGDGKGTLKRSIGEYNFEDGTDFTEPVTATEFRDRIREENDITRYFPKSLPKKFVKGIRKSEFTKPKLYRGMEAGELDFLLENKFIKSNGSYNFSNQQGQTLFDEDAGYALSYATSFAPNEIAAKHYRDGMPSYVVEIVNSPDLNFRKNGVQESYTMQEIPQEFISRIFEVTYDQDTNEDYVQDVTASIKKMLPNLGARKNDIIHGVPMFFRDKTTGTLLYAVQGDDGWENGKYISEKFPDVKLDYEEIAGNKDLAKYFGVSGNESDLVEEDIFGGPSVEENLATTDDVDGNRYSIGEYQDDVELGTLFSGGGTFEYAIDGLIHTQYAAENRPEIVAVYKQNHGGVVFNDVMDVTSEDAKKAQYVHMSPPCIDFSQMRNGRGEKPIDINLAKKMVELIHGARNRAYTIENVSGYLNSKSMQLIQDALNEEGYNWDIGTYRDADYGGYTNRERVVLRAMRDEALPAVTGYTTEHKGWGEAVGEDYLETLPEATKTNPRMLNDLKSEGIDINNLDRPLLVFGESYKNGHFGHAYFDEVCPTIIAESGASRVFMPDGSIKEATPELLAKIMGLDDFKLPKSKVTARRVIGNGIPAAITRNVMGPVVESIKADNAERLARGEDIRYSAGEYQENLQDVYTTENRLNNYIRKNADKASPADNGDIKEFLTDDGRITLDKERFDMLDDYIFDIDDTKFHGMQNFKDIETMIEDSTVNAEAAQYLKDLIVKPWDKAKAAYTKAVTEARASLKEISDSTGILSGSEESAAVQWLGEGYRIVDGETQSYSLEDLKEEFPQTWEKIQKMERYCRQVYDEYIGKINNVLELIYPDIKEKAEANVDAARGKVQELAEKLRLATEDTSKETIIKELNKAWNDLERRTHYLISGEYQKNKRLLPRKDYYHHFMQISTSGVGGLEDILKNAKTRIDPELVGMSEYTKPKTKWMGFLQHQDGGKYTADAVGGMLKYIPSAEYVINIDPVIANNRTIAEEMVRLTSGSKNANDFLTYLTDWTNSMAGKTTSQLDRLVLKSMGDANGRQFLNALSRFNGIVKSNAVIGNLNSAIKQISNIPNAMSIIKNDKAWQKGIAQYVALVAGKGDVRQEAKDLIAQSNFLAERYLDTSDYEFTEHTFGDKLEHFAGAMMEIGDKAAAQLIWYSAYNDAISKNEAEPIYYADRMTRRAISGRGIGETPHGLKGKVFNLLMPFQVEVNGEWQNIKRLVKTNDYNGLARLMVGSYILNALISAVTGSDTLPDILGAVIDGIKRAFKKDKDEDETLRKIFIETEMNIAGQIVSAIPGVSWWAPALLGINDELGEKLFGESSPTRYDTGMMAAQQVFGLVGDIGSDIANGTMDTDLVTPALMTLLPYGGKQVSRTYNTLQDLAVIGNGPFNTPFGERNPMPGSYTNAGAMRFPIEGIDEATRALLFGSYATKAGQDYLSNGYKSYASKELMAKAYKAKDEGVDPQTFLTLYKQMDADKNGRITQDEARQVLDNANGLSHDEKAIIWKYINSGWKAGY